MPVKRRTSKRRVEHDPAAWEMLFECGHDFFRDLPFRTDDEAREAAQDAWEALGPAFLADRRDNPLRPTPWALETFGAPRHAR